LGAIEARDINEPEQQYNLIDLNEDIDVEEYNYQRWNIRLFVVGKLTINAEAIVEVV